MPPKSYRIGGTFHIISLDNSDGGLRHKLSIIKTKAINGYMIYTAILVVFKPSAILNKTFRIM